MQLKKAVSGISEAQEHHRVFQCCFLHKPDINVILFFIQMHTLTLYLCQHISQVVKRQKFYTDWVSLRDRPATLPIPQLLKQKFHILPCTEISIYWMIPELTGL